MRDDTRTPRDGKDPPAIRHLRLVSPAPTTPPPKRRKYQRSAPTFTPEEQARLRAALKNARALFGTWACLADAMRVSEAGIVRSASNRTVSGDLAIRLARALGKPVESLYRAPSDASTCPTCGARRGS